MVKEDRPLGLFVYTCGQMTPEVAEAEAAEATMLLVQSVVLVVIKGQRSVFDAYDAVYIGLVGGGQNSHSFSGNQVIQNPRDRHKAY